jgi:hypothetical protein
VVIWLSLRSPLGRYDRGHPKLNGLSVSACGAAPHVFELLFGAGEADFDALDLAEPALLLGLGEPSLEVLGDLDESVDLFRVRSQDGAADAGVFVLAGGSVGAAADAKFDLAFFEMGEELGPLLVGGLAVFSRGPQGASAGDEGPVVGDPSWG